MVERGGFALIAMSCIFFTSTLASYVTFQPSLPRWLGAIDETHQILAGLVVP